MHLQKQKVRFTQWKVEKYGKRKTLNKMAKINMNIRKSSKYG